MAQNVRVIPATMNRMTSAPIQGNTKRKVAGYARVSTEQEEQQNSYEAQVDYYTRYIQSRDDWQFVSVYTDEGISGTSTKYRTGFQQMIDDAISGKIDLIVTKSVSRFARNTVDSLTTIRELKEHGTEVYFEKENIWTFDSKGELLLTIMSSLAQEESRSISENVRWGIRKKSADGRYSLDYKKILGYDRGDDGRPVINPEQAVLVRRIYADYLEGKSPYMIAKELTDEGIPTPCGKSFWFPNTVRSVLSNEIYMGDKLLQKTYSVDFLSKKRIKNQGQVPQYYVEADHEAIIPPQTFKLVQDEVRRRKNRRAYGKTIFSGKMYCSECGGMYGSKVWHSNDKYRRVIWQCNNKYGNGHTGCKTPHLTEDIIIQAFENVLCELTNTKDEVIVNLKSLNDGLSTDDLEADLSHVEIDLNSTIALIQQMIDQNSRVALNQAEYNLRFNELSERCQELENERGNIETRIRDIQTRKQKIKEFIDILGDMDITPVRFDKVFWCSMVDHVTVHPKTLNFTLSTGESMEVQI